MPNANHMFISLSIATVHYADRVPIDPEKAPAIAYWP